MVKVYGCYFMSLLQAAEVDDYMDNMYNECLEHRWIMKDCTVLSPVQIYNLYAAGNKHYRAVITKGTDAYTPDAVVIYELTKWLNGKEYQHFVLEQMQTIQPRTMHPDYSHIWDPLGERPGRSEYVINSYRVLH